MTMFWMTWKPTGWPVDELRQMVARFEREGSTVASWRVIAHRKVAVGDTAILFKQGDNPRGIFGIGTIIGEPAPSPGDARNSAKVQYRVPILWTRLVDPTKDTLLPLADLVGVIPKWFVDSPAAGYALPSDAARKLAMRLDIEPELQKLDIGPDLQTHSRNPPWNRDELILALDAYLNWEGKPPAAASQDIAALSSLLNDLRRVLGTRGGLTLRNPNGVYMKLMNFRRFDPSFIIGGKIGLSRGNQLEKEVWNEFHDDRGRLRAISSLIKASVMEALATGEIINLLEVEMAGGVEAIEGIIFTVQHQRRERSKKLVTARKAMAAGKLVCEVCDFDFAARYGERGVGFIECHHNRAIQTLGDGTKTRLQDLALLCSNCHRMIHARRPWVTPAQLKAALLPLRMETPFSSVA